MDGWMDFFLMDVALSGEEVWLDGCVGDDDDVKGRVSSK